MAKGDRLSHPATDAIAQILIERLAQARVALQHLVDDTDPEALHDFRVAIRRMRSTASAWRRALKGRIKKTHRRTLRNVQRATGKARDAEVGLAWLDGQASPAQDDVAGFDALRRRLQGRLDGDAQGRDALVTAFSTAEAAWQSALARPSSGSDRLYAPALAKRIRQHTKRLRKRLRRACATRDFDLAHQARIRAKLLRYLVEPVLDDTEGGRPLVKACKRLQTILGDMNDAHVLGAEFDAMLHDSDLAQATESGLRTLVEKTDDRRSTLLDRLIAWQDTDAPDLWRAAKSLVQELKLATADAEIERKFLLRAMPEIPDGARIQEMHQGYLPSVTDGTVERVRSIREGDSVRFVRTLKSGLGLERRELEQDIGEARFETLWAKTLGRRVHKRRHVVTEGVLTWEIDEFLDRELVLAEVELTNPTQDSALPTWLAAVLDREVTEDAQYMNSTLAS